MKRFSVAMPLRRLLVLLLLLAVSVGCGQSAGRIPVNEFAAREACEAFLDAWQEGLTPKDLQPNIHGADYLWNSGQKLISYEILPAETNHGTSLLVSAKLTLRNARGVESKSIAGYTVGTSPVITVIRDDP